MTKDSDDFLVYSPKSEILSSLKTSENGLTHLEAKKRLKLNGPNVISDKKEFNIVLEFLSHFLNPLILILVFASILSFFMGAVTDSILIGAIILFGVILDFIQEYSASFALKKLSESVKTTATVIRDN